MVGLGRFELPTSPLSGVRSNQLSYRPEPLGDDAPYGRADPAGVTREERETWTAASRKDGRRTDREHKARIVLKSSDGPSIRRSGSAREHP